VFQDAILDDSLTVAENVIEGALYAGASHRTASREAAMLLERYGIAGLASTTPNRISGGQAQRVALCRALLHHPALLLADEPTGNLDADSASTVLAGLREAATAGTAVLIVTHDLRVALGCDRSLTLV
jgi:ABC-type lipoprotein export system ATPase subunit